MQVRGDIPVSSVVFISSAFITHPFIPVRFVMLLWKGTFCGIALFPISRFGIKKLGLENRCAQWISSTVLAFGLLNIQTLLDEGSHAFVGKVLLQRSRITITVIPFFGGSTKCTPMTASLLGKIFRAQKIFLLIAAAGPLFSVGLSCFFLQWGIKKLEPCPGIGRLAICAATMDILFHFRAAISALQMSPTSLQYDFVAIKTLGGIHPFISACIIIGFPIFFGYRASTQKGARLTHLEK